MKLHQIAFAVAALAAGSANAAITPTFTIYMDGATAIGNSVTDVAKAMCKDAASTQAYQGGPGNKIKGVYCSDVNTINSGLAAGTKLWVVKNNVDGSLEAFDRAILRNAQTVVLDEATCPTPTFSGTLTCTGTKLVNAHGGFSDVEGDIWKARGQFNPGTVAYTTKAGFAGQGFGIAVNDALYQAMQAAQGLTVGATDVANQPNMTKQQFTSILSGTGAYHTDWSPIVGAAGAGKAVNLCRRVPVSGTQAGMEVFFLNSPCASADPTFGAQAVATAADSIPGAFVVTENAGTGDVKICLNSAETATDFAVGIMSLENARGASDKWRFVKLDGVSPTPDASQRQTVIDGQYNYAFESVYVYRNDNTTAQKNFMNKFISLMGDPAKVNPLVGIFTVPGSTASATYTNFPTRVHKGTTGGNSCAPFALTE